MAFGIYAAKNVKLTYGQLAITGLAEGSFVKLALNKDTFAWSPGSDGEGCFVQEADESGGAEFTLHQASDSIADLNQKADDQKNGVSGPESFVVRDMNGSYLGECVGMLARKADTERSNTTTNSSWKVVSGQLNQSGGGVT